MAILPFVGEIRCFPFSPPPENFVPCDGRSLSIPQFQILYTMIGTTYGGDTSQFNVPDLRGRLILGAGNSHVGQRQGNAEVSLVVSHLPAHTHSIRVFSGSSNTSQPSGALLSSSASTPFYISDDGFVVLMRGDAVSPSGGGRPHNNLQPYQPTGFAIATVGMYPSTGGSIPYGLIGEIKFCSTELLPHGWLRCDGQQLNIAEYLLLYSVIGNTYGGDATTFRLPDLRDRVLVGMGQGPGLSNRNLGESGGVTEVVLTPAQMPSHSHSLRAVNAPPEAGEDSPDNRNLAAAPHFSAGSADGTLAASLSTTGSNIAHLNQQPTLTMWPIICAQGVIPKFDEEA